MKTKIILLQRCFFVGVTPTIVWGDARPSLTVVFLAQAGHVGHFSFKSRIMQLTERGLLFELSDGRQVLFSVGPNHGGAGL